MVFPTPGAGHQPMVRPISTRGGMLDQSAQGVGCQTNQHPGWMVRPISTRRGCSDHLSVEGSSAVVCFAQTWDLLILNGEFVVVGDLLVDADRLPGVDHNLLLRIHCDDLCIAVWLKEKQLEHVGKNLNNRLCT